jgi:hypothetical protein
MVEAVCVAGISIPKAHLDQSGADMNILNSETPYVPSAKTDISRTLKRTGWTPPSEDKEIQKKWEYYRTISMRNERKLK